MQFLTGYKLFYIRDGIMNLSSNFDKKALESLLAKLFDAGKASK